MKSITYVGMDVHTTNYTLCCYSVEDDRFFAEIEVKPDYNGEIDHLLYEDESMISDYQAIQKSWFVKGQQRVIQTNGTHESVKLLGILNYEPVGLYRAGCRSCRVYPSYQ